MDRGQRELTTQPLGGAEERVEQDARPQVVAAASLAAGCAHRRQRRLRVLGPLALSAQLRLPRRLLPRERAARRTQRLLCRPGPGLGPGHALVLLPDRPAQRGNLGAGLLEQPAQPRRVAPC